MSTESSTFPQSNWCPPWEENWRTHPLGSSLPLSFLPAMSHSHRKPRYYFTSMQAIEKYPGVRDKRLVYWRWHIVRQALCHAFHKGNYRVYNLQGNSQKLQKQPPESPIVLLNSWLQSTLQRCSIVIDKRSIHFSFALNCQLCLYLILDHAGSSKIILPLCYLVIYETEWTWTRVYSPH